MPWLELLAAQGALKSLLSTTVQKHQGEANSSDPGGLKPGLVQGEPRAVILSLGPGRASGCDSEPGLVQGEPRAVILSLGWSRASLGL